MIGGFCSFSTYLKNEEHFRLFTILQSTEIGGWEKFKLGASMIERVKEALTLLWLFSVFYILMVAGNL